MSSIGEILKGMTVVDAGVGMPAALVSKFLQELGATVVRKEPDGGDPGKTLYPAYSIWRQGQQPATASLDALLVNADLCIIGGEDFPGIERPVSAAELSRSHSRLIVVDIAGYPPAAAHRDRRAVEVLVQARSGLAYEHYTNRPLRFGFEACTYGAVLQAIAGSLAALFERERSGLGQVVSTSLFEGALFYAITFWSEAERPTPLTEFTAPKDPFPLIFECADGDYIHIGLGSVGSKYQLFKVLKIDDPSVKPDDAGIPKVSGDRKNFFGDIDLLARHIKPWKRDELQKALDDVKVPNEKVMAPGECWDDPQIQANGTIGRTSDGTRYVGNPIIFQPTSAARTKKRAAGGKPLEGVRVVDFGAFVAGPLASAVLADFGADVIKIEATGSDPSRVMFHSFNASNRGKLCLGLDIKSREAAPVMAKLIESADVVTNNFRPGVSARLGLDPATLHRARPDLIVLESPAYGSEGPGALKAGFDPIIQAFTGHEYRAGGQGNAPLWNRGFMADFTAGQIGAIALLAALYHRERTGAGATLSAALVNGGIYTLSELIQRADGSFTGAPELNRARTGMHPSEAMYEASDGWIAIAARDEKAARHLGEVLGISAQLSRPRAAWDDTEYELIAAAIRKRPLAEVAAALEAAGVWTEECVRDGRLPALRDRDLLASGVTSDTGYRDFGSVKAVGVLVRLSRTPTSVDRAAPAVCQHSKEVLASLGFDSSTTATLIERKVVV
ncbi:MAG: CoA transferase [Steroidobacteraceae bacterium]